ncbi:MAG: DUF4252 domain-containing protein [Bacteroidales bacterium]|jgi:hypothetical protein|nr:DUF4252 domain-containing protein [Bacteroidales bacterium]
MKKLVLLFVVSAMCLMVAAQDGNAEKLFEDFSTKKGVTSIYMSEYMLNMFSNVESDDPDFDKMIKGLTSIKVLTGSPEDKSINIYSVIQKKLLADKSYKELMMVTEGEQNIKFLIKEGENRKVSELLMISVGGEKSDNIFVIIQGKIDLASIHHLAKVNGLKSIENIEEK